MTTASAPAAAPATETVRVAVLNSTCPNCDVPIQPGRMIRKRPGHAWEHVRCPSAGKAPERSQ